MSVPEIFIPRILGHQLGVSTKFETHGPIITASDLRFLLAGQGRGKLWRGMPKVPELNLKEGDEAPEFEAETQDGTRVSLRSLRGKPVVLFFYPKDDTPGCTKEACGFRDIYADFQGAGAEVFGISVDPLKSHRKFSEKFELPYQLLADPEKKIVQDYGVWGEKSFMGRKYMGTHRVTFLIDPEGRIARIWPAVKPVGHAAEVLEAIRASTS